MQCVIKAVVGSGIGGVLGVAGVSFGWWLSRRQQLAV
jgi:hypothetical protein